MDVNIEQLIAKFDTRYVLRQYISRLRRRMADVEALAARLETLSSGQQLRIAQVTLPALVLGGVNNQTITWGRRMPSATYSVYPDVSAVVGAATVTFPNQTDTQLQVRTTASGVVAVGTRVLVLAWTD